MYVFSGSGITAVITGESYLKNMDDKMGNGLKGGLRGLYCTQEPEELQRFHSLILVAAIVSCIPKPKLPKLLHHAFAAGKLWRPFSS